MTDLKSPKLIYLKGWLFLAILIISSSLLLLQSRDATTLILILLIIWSAARFYYFMFYVIEKYVDSAYKFDGIISFIRYLVRNRNTK
jgi:hypothetical protein